jgi:SulP family sulfate permease
MLNPLSILTESVKGYRLSDVRRDVLAGVNVMTLALPLSMAFAIASGVSPEAGLYSAIIGGAVIALFGASPVQIGGPTGAFIIITYSVVERYGLNGLFLCTLLAGAMLCLMGLARFGSIIRYIPYPVSRAFTKGIAVLILSSQLKNFFGLPVEKLPVDFLGKIHMFAENIGGVHLPTLALAVASTLLIALWPARFCRFLPGSMFGLIVATLVSLLFNLPAQQNVATIGTAFGGFSSALPAFQLPVPHPGEIQELLQPAFTIALLVAMQALLCAVVTDGLLDHRSDSNRELIGQGLANLVGPLFGCIPVTGAVARSVLNVQAGGRSPLSALVHCLLLALSLLVAAPLVTHIPLAALSAVLVVASWRMVPWLQIGRILRWPRSDAMVFLLTFALTVLTTLTLAVQVGVVLAALLMVKRISETSRITAVDESTETEGSQHSLVGRSIPEGVLIFRIFGAFFFGVVDKLDEELKRSKRDNRILILRTRKVLAIDATGLQALEDLHAKLNAQGKHLILSGPHTQPLMVMQQAGFLDRLGLDNVCPDIGAALARAREILGLPPGESPEETHKNLYVERKELEAVRRELNASLAHAQALLKSMETPEEKKNS